MGGRRTSRETLRQLLNRLRWGATAEAAGVMLTFRVRESGEERVRRVAFEAVAEILARGVNLADGTFLPYHRFVAVFRAGEVLWEQNRT